MTTLWDVHGANLDLGYVNVRDGQSRVERELREALDVKWAAYEPYADPDFREGFARDPHARFWEMFLGEALLQAGKTLLTSIAPEVGEDGPDQVRGPTPINEGGGLAPAPERQAQLRTTSALWTKSKVLEQYLRDGIIAPEDARLIAIGAGRFGVYVPEDPLPLILSAVFPIGDAFVTLDAESGDVLDQGFRPSFEIARQGGAIPRTAFLDPRFSHVSGVLWSRVGIGNWARAQRPLTLVHNPLASVSMAKRWPAWDREFIAVQDGDRWVASDILASDPE